MVKVKATGKFNLAEWEKVKIIERANEGDNLKGTIYKDDIIECDKKMAEYLLGKNDYKRAFVELLEYIPEEKPIKKKTSKK